MARALAAADDATRARWAAAGLALDPPDGLSPDTQVLLLRQLYIARLGQGDLESALEIAERMSAVGALRDIALTDEARVLAALGRSPESIRAQREAARESPEGRVVFHLFSLAGLQYFGGNPAGALSSLRRAERLAKGERPLVRAMAAYVRLSLGETPAELADVQAELLASRSREGYGRFLLGMILYHMGDKLGCVPHLRAFLARNAASDPAKTLTLRRELDEARRALAELTSD